MGHDILCLSRFCGLKQLHKNYWALFNSGLTWSPQTPFCSFLSPLVVTCTSVYATKSKGKQDCYLCGKECPRLKKKRNVKTHEKISNDNKDVAGEGGWLKKNLVGTKSGADGDQYNIARQFNANMKD